MPMTSDVPDSLKPYIFHGVDLNTKSSDKEVLGECPFCSSESKFSVNVESGKWRCFVCGEGGNQYTFLELLWKENNQSSVPIAHLASERGLKVSTLMEWKVVVSSLTGEYLVPGYNTKGELRQLYRYVVMRDGRKRLLATPTIHHQIHGVNLYDSKKSVVYLCEGPWDAMKLWETLGSTRELRGRFVSTSNQKVSLLGGANVLAVPGCSTFHDSWSSVFLKKKVYIVYDNDHPKKHPSTGKLLKSAGYSGVQRVSGILGVGPSEIGYLKWGREGFDSKLPSGMDVSDFLNGGTNKIGDLFSKIEKVPKSWLTSEVKKVEKSLNPVECKHWLKLSNQWRRALYWDDGLDTALSVMLACVISTDIPGEDQLWVKIIGPASCGKSTLSEGLSIARKYVVPKDTFTGLTSGYQLERDGGKNLSLIEKLNGKTLIINDGDTLLQLPNLNQVVSQLRAFYGRNLRTSYKNEMSKDHEGVNTTIIVCGTSSLRVLDQSELGERFLDCVIMEGIQDAHEDEVLMRVAERENRNAQGEEGEGDNKEITLAKQMTGGYVNHLRANATMMLSRVQMSKKDMLLITRVGKFVAIMRARPSDKQKEKAEREFGARLVSQHIRLANCLAGVLNKTVVDVEVMRRTIGVALDTSRGITFDICTYLYDREEGVEQGAIGLRTNQSEDTIRKMLRFLKQIGVLEHYQKKVAGVRSRVKWRMTKKIRKLFSDVVHWEK